MVHISVAKCDFHHFARKIGWLKQALRRPHRSLLVALMSHEECLPLCLLTAIFLWEIKKRQIPTQESFSVRPLVGQSVRLLFCQAGFFFAQETSPLTFGFWPSSLFYLLPFLSDIMIAKYGWHETWTSKTKNECRMKNGWRMNMGK